VQAVNIDAHSVYYLLDPRDRSVRYVGVSKKPKDRLHQHIRRIHKKTHQIYWVRELQAAGLQPILEVQCIVQDANEAFRIEIALIAILGSRGAKLTNMTSGGTGSSEAGKMGASAAKEKVTCEERYQYASNAARKGHEIHAKTDPDGYRRRQQKAGRNGGRKGVGENKRHSGRLAGLKSHENAKKNPQLYRERQQRALSGVTREQRLLGNHRQWHEARGILKPEICIFCARKEQL
jgi:hypothetical protein